MNVSLSWRFYRFGCNVSKCGEECECVWINKTWVSSGYPNLPNKTSKVIFSGRTTTGISRGLNLHSLRSSFISHRGRPLWNLASNNIITPVEYPKPLPINWSIAMGWNVFTRAQIFLRNCAATDRRRSSSHSHSLRWYFCSFRFACLHISASWFYRCARNDEWEGDRGSKKVAVLVLQIIIRGTRIFQFLC